MNPSYILLEVCCYGIDICTSTVRCPVSTNQRTVSGLIWTNESASLWSSKTDAWRQRSLRAAPPSPARLMWRTKLMPGASSFWLSRLSPRLRRSRVEPRFGRCPRYNNTYNNVSASCPTPARYTWRIQNQYTNPRNWYLITLTPTCLKTNNNNKVSSGIGGHM